MCSGRQKAFRRRRYLRAFTVLEVVISILIIMVLVNGVLGYQYFSTRDVRLSEVQASASRLGLLLLESWKGSGGIGTFDPLAEFSSELTMETLAEGPDVPEDEGAVFVKLGSYGVQMENTYFFITLSKAEATEQEPAILSAVIAWKKDYSSGELDGTESAVRFSSFVTLP